MINVPEITKVSTGKIIVDRSNPNAMSDEKYQALKRNIERYGFLIPVITNKDYKIADGFHRWKAGRELGLTEVPVIALDIDEVDRRMLRQILNKLRGEHDASMDAVEYQYIIEQGQGDLFEELSTISVDELNKIAIDFEDAFSNIPEGEKSEYEQMTFTLHNEQAELIRLKLDESKNDELFESAKDLNENSNSNALWVVCSKYGKS